MLMENKIMPAVVCLCGSTRFVDTFNEWYSKLTYEGKIVLSIGVFSNRQVEQERQYDEPEMKKKLEELHRHKIDLADEIMVLNVHGYIGESTSREIEYAKKNGKSVRYLEAIDSPDIK